MLVRNNCIYIIIVLIPAPATLNPQSYRCNHPASPTSDTCLGDAVSYLPVQHTRLSHLLPITSFPVFDQLQYTFFPANNSTQILNQSPQCLSLTFVLHLPFLSTTRNHLTNPPTSFLVLRCTALLCAQYTALPN